MMRTDFFGCMRKTFISRSEAVPYKYSRKIPKICKAERTKALCFSLNLITSFLEMVIIYN